MKKEIIICLMLVLASLNLAVADSNHTISVVPSLQTVNLNSSFSVGINITPASPVSSAACNISFNPSVLRANSVTNGGMFETWPENLTIVIDNTAGRISYIMAVSSSPKTQEGTFAIINFTATGTGSSYINIENPIVHGTTDLVVLNGSVSVIYEDTIPPDVQVIYPDGGETLYVGTIENIRWNATDNYGVQSINIYYSTNGGAAYSPLVIGTENDGIYEWLVPDTPSTNCKIKVVAYDYASNMDYDESNSTFIIIRITPILSYEPGYFDFNLLQNETAESTFEIWNSGNGILYYNLTETCAWLSLNLTGGSSSGEHDYIKITVNTAGLSIDSYTCNISINSNGGSGTIRINLTVIEYDNIPPSISEVVATPPVQDAGKYLKISCIVTDNLEVSDVFLNITYPNLTYENFSIFANRTGNTFFSNRTYSLIGNYSFFIYAIDSSNNPNISALQYFEIGDITPPSVGIIYPVGNEFISGNVTIRWNASDNYNGANITITIKYSPNGGGIWINIASNEANDGSYTWNTVGLDDGTNYMIMVVAQDSSHNSGSAISKNFTVDNTKPEVRIDKPERGKMYIFDRIIIPIIGKPIIIGKITVEVTASDTYEIQKVEFYIDDIKKSEDFSYPYSWTCDEKLILSHKIKVMAYDKAGNKNEEEIEAIFFNLL